MNTYRVGRYFRLFQYSSTPKWNKIADLRKPNQWPRIVIFRSSWNTLTRSSDDHGSCVHIHITRSSNDPVVRRLITGFSTKSIKIRNTSNTTRTVYCNCAFWIVCPPHYCRAIIFQAVFSTTVMKTKKVACARNVRTTFSQS